MSRDLTSDLRAGPLARMGLLSDTSVERVANLLSDLASTDLETVRVLFPDQHGILRGKTIVASALTSVFLRGLSVTSTLLLKDTSHRTAFPVWSEDTDLGQDPMRGASDVLLVPDPDTFRPLPWSPKSAWILCDVHEKSGAPLAFTPRHVLREAVTRLTTLGFDMRIGLEAEFHVFEQTDPRREHADTTMPGAAPLTRPLAHGYQLLTETHYDALEPVMDLLRRSAQGLGLSIRSTEVEMGPSQFEFTFDPADPMQQADAMVMFRSMVKQVCARQGLHASFMCRPVLPNCAASGWHVHQSLLDAKTGGNLFMPAPGESLSPTASRWIAGLLRHARESCLLTTPSVNGYKRYQPFQLAPDRIQWGHDNRGAMIRALVQSGDPASRIENRVPEPTANPYYLFASQILGGLDGITQALTPPDPIEMPYDNGSERLPTNLGEAITAFEQSAFYRSTLGDATVDYYTRLKRAEWDRYLAHLSEWEQTEYFSLF